MHPLTDAQFLPKNGTDEGLDDVVIDLAGVAQVRALGLGREDVPKELADETKYLDGEVPPLNVRAVDNDHEPVLKTVGR